MNKNVKRMITVCAAVICLCFGMLLMTGCGSTATFEDYMQSNSALRQSIDAQMTVLSPEAKGTVQYKDDSATVVVSYYSLTEMEIQGLEASKIAARCSAIMQPAVEQYFKETGKQAQLSLAIKGHDSAEGEESQ